jgi:lysophospholipase L1-like esterase
MKIIELDRDSRISNTSKCKLKVKPTFINTKIDDGLLNRVTREYRERKYREKIRNFRGIKIVSKGDSWFQFPFVLKDTIDILSDEYAILSLDTAGDTLENMVATDEITQAIGRENPDIFLISGGGNDMFINGVFSSWLNPFESNLKPEKYLNENFDRFVDKITYLYGGLFTKMSDRHPELRIVCHGYDYIIPRKAPFGIFMGNNMQERGIIDRDLQREIMKIAIDRLNDAQIDLVSRFPSRVFHVDCRNAVNTNDWFDEIHPNSDGFKSLANRFRTVIENIIEV